MSFLQFSCCLGVGVGQLSLEATFPGGDKAAEATQSGELRQTRSGQLCDAAT